MLFLYTYTRLRTCRDMTEIVPMVDIDQPEEKNEYKDSNEDYSGFVPQRWMKCIIGKRLFFSPRCCICMEDDVRLAYVFSHCGHACVCDSCSPAVVRNKSYTLNTCLICKSKGGRYMRLDIYKKIVDFKT